MQKMSKPLPIFFTMHHTYISLSHLIFSLHITRSQQDTPPLYKSKVRIRIHARFTVFSKVHAPSTAPISVKAVLSEKKTHLIVFSLAKHIYRIGTL